MKSNAATGAADLFRLVRSGINVGQISSHVKKPFRFLLCGDPALVAELRAALLDGHDDGRVPLDAAATLETIDPSRGRTIAVQDARCVIFLGRENDLAGARLDLLVPLRLPILAITVDDRIAPGASSGSPAAGKVTEYLVPALTHEALRTRVFPAIVETCKGVEIAVGRRLPALREAISTKLSRDAAKNALRMAAASAVADHIPVLGFVVGAVASAGDMVAITAVQVRLMLQIGAVYGRDPDLQRMWELLPVIGGGFAWRTLARELSGFIPVAGIAVKGAIAYAGTIVVGEGAMFFYQHGRHMSANDASKLYEETKASALQLGRELLGRLRKNG